MSSCGHGGGASTSRTAYTNTSLDKQTTGNRSKLLWICLCLQLSSSLQIASAMSSFIETSLSLDKIFLVIVYGSIPCPSSAPSYAREQYPSRVLQGALPATHPREHRLESASQSNASSFKLHGTEKRAITDQHDQHSAVTREMGLTRK
ncbi:hypothetical protein P692DRAFT_20837289 [Suillus brevipes Sb2]|nr:hypothetical protein P692DRAFT_20837289 [Suillus brevipes Sb2]